MKKLFLMLVSMICVVFTFTGCGEIKTATAESEVTTEKEEATLEETNIEETKKTINEEPEEVVKTSFVKLNGGTVTEFDGTYSGSFTFVGYNKDENGDPVMDELGLFDCPFEVSKDEVENGDGTKTITYKTVFDISKVSFVYDDYSSMTFTFDQASGVAFNEESYFNTEVNGETVKISYELVEEFDENYTTHTKYDSITCPCGYDNYAYVIAETLTPFDESNVLRITDTGLDFSNENYVVLH